MLRRLIESQGYRCALTGESLTPKTATVDHVTPLTRGGAHAIENAQVIVDYVNQAKGQMTNDEFIAMCVAVARLHGPQVAHDDDTHLDD